MNVILLFANSDITVCFADQKIKAHKFVLAARGDHWSNRDLNEINQLELAGNLIMECFFLKLQTSLCCILEDGL